MDQLLADVRYSIRSFADRPLVFAAVCLVATYVPARRAASVDPIVARKQE